MIAVDGEDWDCDIDVGIFIVDMVECTMLRGVLLKRFAKKLVKIRIYPWNASVPSLSISSSQGFSP